MRKCKPCVRYNIEKNQNVFDGIFVTHKFRHKIYE